MNSRLALVLPGDSSRPHYAFSFTLAVLYCPEADILVALVFVFQRDYSITSMDELYTDEAGKCAANVMTKENGVRGGHLHIRLSSKRMSMHEAQHEILTTNEGKILEFCPFTSYPNEHNVPPDLLCFGVKDVY